MSKININQDLQGKKFLVTSLSCFASSGIGSSIGVVLSKSVNTYPIWLGPTVIAISAVVASLGIFTAPRAMRYVESRRNRE
jgi:hypothetical protein